MYVVIGNDITVVGNAKAMTQSLERTLQSIFGIFWCSRRSSVVRGSPGGSDHEILMSELVNSFNPNGRETRVPEYRSRSKRS